MANHTKKVNTTTVLSQCNEIFSKALGLSYKLKIQNSYQNLD